MPPDLTREQYTDLLRKLDEVCEQARELARQLKAEMATRARQDQQFISPGVERRRTPRNRRTSDDRRTRKPQS